MWSVSFSGVGGGPSVTGKIDMISSDPAVVIPGSHVVIWCGPVVATREVFEWIAPSVAASNTA